VAPFPHRALERVDGRVGPLLRHFEEAELERPLGVLWKPLDQLLQAGSGAGRILGSRTVEAIQQAIAFWYLGGESARPDHGRNGQQEPERGVELRWSLVHARTPRADSRSLQDFSSIIESREVRGDKAPLWGCRFQPLSFDVRMSR
jgi:hypothetical protein